MDSLIWSLMRDDFPNSKWSLADCEALAGIEETAIQLQPAPEIAESPHGAMPNGFADGTGVHKHPMALLRLALASCRFAAQRIVGGSGNIVAHEMLLRPAIDEIKDPLQLIALVERTGAFRLLGNRVRSLVSDTLQDPGIHTLFVNVHPMELLSDDWVRAVDLHPFSHRIVLELTESMPPEICDDISENLQALTEIGYRIAIDDFGSGHMRSHQMLRHFVSFVKLDRHLLVRLHEDEHRQRLIAATIKIVHRYEAKVVAEGIETQSDLDTVRQLGADLFQGYHLGRPVLLEPVE